MCRDWFAINKACHVRPILVDSKKGKAIENARMNFVTTVSNYTHDDLNNALEGRIIKGNR